MALSTRCKDARPSALSVHVRGHGGGESPRPAHEPRQSAREALESYADSGAENLVEVPPSVPVGPSLTAQGRPSCSGGWGSGRAQDSRPAHPAQPWQPDASGPLASIPSEPRPRGPAPWPLMQTPAWRPPHPHPASSAGATEVSGTPSAVSLILSEVGRAQKPGTGTRRAPAALPAARGLGPRAAGLAGRGRGHQSCRARGGPVRGGDHHCVTPVESNLSAEQFELK